MISFVTEDIKLHDTTGKDKNMVFYRAAEVDAELKRLRDVLQKISVWGCNGQCVELCGTKCPCCIALAAMEE